MSGDGLALASPSCFSGSAFGNLQSRPHLIWPMYMPARTSLIPTCARMSFAMAVIDIVAKAPANTPPETVKLMLQTLLADRFKLKVHMDNKSLPAFVLAMGKDKPKLKESDGSESKCPGVLSGVPCGGSRRLMRYGRF